MPFCSVFSLPGRHSGYDWLQKGSGRAVPACLGCIRNRTKFRPIPIRSFGLLFSPPMHLFCSTSNSPLKEINGVRQNKTLRSV